MFDSKSSSQALPLTACRRLVLTEGGPENHKIHYNTVSYKKLSLKVYVQKKKKKAVKKQKRLYIRRLT